MKLPEFRESIRLELGDDAVNPEVFTEDDLLDHWIIQGVLELSRLKPLFTTTTFIVAANTFRYDAPAGLKTLIRVARISDSVFDDEYEVEAVYEPARDKIHLTDFSGVATGEELTVEYTKEYTVPTETVDTDVPDRFIEAINLYATAQGLAWLARRATFKSRGILEFAVGRYSQKGTDSTKVILDEMKERMDRFRAIIGADEPAIEFSGANSGNPLRRSPSLTGVPLTEEGWGDSDDTSGMRSHSPGRKP